MQNFTFVNLFRLYISRKFNKQAIFARMRKYDDEHICEKNATKKIFDASEGTVQIQFFSHEKVSNFI